MLSISQYWPYVIIYQYIYVFSFFFLFFFLFFSFFEEYSLPLFNLYLLGHKLGFYRDYKREDNVNSNSFLNKIE